MYETIMDLPLFKGVGADHVSAFLEKTSIHFLKFSPGDSIVRKGEAVKSLKFILSGTIRVFTDVLNGQVSVSSLFSGHEALGVTRLFGLHPFYDISVEAVDSVSIMEFGKDKYFGLLQSDPIYMMNFANLLSLNVQRNIETFPSFVRLDISRLFAEWLLLFTSRKSEDIRIKGVQEIKNIYGVDYSESCIRKLEALSLVSVDDDEILVPDREALIEYAAKL